MLCLTTGPETTATQVHRLLGLEDELPNATADGSLDVIPSR